MIIEPIYRLVNPIIDGRDVFECYHVANRTNAEHIESNSMEFQAQERAEADLC